MEGGGSEGVNQKYDEPVSFIPTKQYEGNTQLHLTCGVCVCVFVCVCVRVCVCM